MFVAANKAVQSKSGAIKRACMVKLQSCDLALRPGKEVVKAIRSREKLAVVAINATVYGNLIGFNVGTLKLSSWVSATEFVGVNRPNSA
jgi:hypothetical protein